MQAVFVNGERDGGLPGNDPGFTRGLNVFESLRTYGKQPFRLRHHLERLVGSCTALGIVMPPIDALRQEVLEASQLMPNACIRIALTAGGNRVLTVEAIDESRIAAPLRLATVEMQPAAWLPGTVKHGSRASWILACRHYGVDEVLITDRSGTLLECNRSNVFVVIGGRLCTPALDGGQLAGVTRAALLEAAALDGLDVHVGPIARAAAIQHMYVSSTLKELAPVTELDGEALPGWDPNGRRLLAAFRALAASECGIVA